MKLHCLLLVAGLMASTYAQAANPEVNLKTNMGTITLELYPAKAPKTVANFLQYVKSGHYNHTIFHRVINGFMIQGGGFVQQGNHFSEKPTRPPIPNEANNGLKNDKYTVAMARTIDPNSATAQFFINVANNKFLNYTAPTMQGWGYAVFGRVIKGQDVVDRIAHVPTHAAGPFESDVPVTPVLIEQATVAKPAVRH